MVTLNRYSSSPFSNKRRMKCREWEVMCWLMALTRVQTILNAFKKNIKHPTAAKCFYVRIFNLLTWIENAYLRFRIHPVLRPVLAVFVGKPTILNDAFWIHVFELNIAWCTTIQMTIFINSQSFSCVGTRHTFSWILHLTLELPTSRVLNTNILWMTNRKCDQKSSNRKEMERLFISNACIKCILVFSIGFLLNKIKMKFPNSSSFCIILEN